MRCVVPNPNALGERNGIDNFERTMSAIADDTNRDNCNEPGIATATEMGVTAVARGAQREVVVGGGISVGTMMTTAATIRYITCPSRPWGRMGYVTYSSPPTVF